MRVWTIQRWQPKEGGGWWFDTETWGTGKKAHAQLKRLRMMGLKVRMKPAPAHREKEEGE